MACYDCNVLRGNHDQVPFAMPEQHNTLKIRNMEPQPYSTDITARIATRETTSAGWTLKITIKRPDTTTLIWSIVINVGIYFLLRAW